MLSDEERVWLKALNVELWPPKDEVPQLVRDLERHFRESGLPLHDPSPPPPPEPREKVTREELAEVFGIVERAPLMTVMVAHGMFSGIGVTLYEHELFPGSGPEPILTLADTHLPRLNDRTVYEHMMGVPPKTSPGKPGDVHAEAWEFFTKFTHTPKNREWLTRYKITMSFDRVAYEY
jgi:hypothetical protein